MNRQDIEKLIGGYATGTLTAEERAALFAAALEDQALFDALAREEPLREALADPAARAHLLAALGESRPGFAQRVGAWLRRPSVLALGASVAVAVVAVVVTVGQRGKAPVEQARVQTAEVRPSPPIPRAPEREAPPAVASIERREERAAPRRKVESAPARPPAGLTGGVIGGIVSAPRQEPFQVAEAPPPPPPATTESIGVVGGVPGVPVPPAPQKPAEQKNAVTAADAAAQQPAPLRMRMARNDSRREGAAAEAAARVMIPPVLARTSFAAGEVPLRYTVVRAHEQGSLRAGERFHLRFESDAAGWLYVLKPDDAGWRVIAARKIEPGKPVLAPASGSLQFDQPGRQEMIAIGTAFTLPLQEGGTVRTLPGAAPVRITLEIAPR